MAYTEFYVTKGASASNNNGGGPSLGSGDGPVVTRANCSSDGAGTTITDDSSTGWSGASEGDWICFDPATEADRARIVSISGNDIVVTPAVTASQSSKAVNVGGAWATIQYAADIVTTSFLDASSNPPRVNIKAEASAYDESPDFDTNTGTVAIPITFQGYTSTAGDGGQASISSSDNNDMIDVGAVDYLVFADFYLKKTGSNAARCLDANGRLTLTIVRCKIEQASTGNAHAIYNIAGRLEDCHVLVTSASGSQACIDYIASSGTVRRCSFIGGRSSCVLRNSGNISECVARDSVSGDGIQCENNGQIISCTIHGNASDGISVNSSKGNVLVSKCIITNNGAYGIDATSGYVVGRNNTFGTSGTANTSGTTTGKYYEVVEVSGSTDRGDQTEDPAYVNAASDDFSLSSSSPCLSEQHAIPGESYYTYVDRGASQKLITSSGGGGFVAAGVGRFGVQEC